MKDWAVCLTKKDKKHIMYISLHPEFWISYIYEYTYKIPPNQLLWLYIFLFIYLFNLAVPGLSCDMQDLFPWPEIKPKPPALQAQSLNHQATKEASHSF